MPRCASQQSWALGGMASADTHRSHAMVVSHKPAVAVTSCTGFCGMGEGLPHAGPGGGSCCGARLVAGLSGEGARRAGQQHDFQMGIVSDFM